MTVVLDDAETGESTAHDPDLFNVVAFGMVAASFANYLIFEDVFEDLAPVLSVADVGG